MRRFIINHEPARTEVIDYIRGLSLDTPKVVEIKRKVKSRSNNQNRLMWAWINQITDYVSDYTGMDSDDVHEFFKAKFLPASGHKQLTIKGQTVERLTTTTLSTTEMRDYMERISAFCAQELSISLPYPEDLQRHW